MEHGGNIRVANARRRSGFAQKTKSRRFITKISLADDFQCHGAVQIDVDRFVSYPHRTATQLDRFPIFAVDQLIVLKSLCRLFRSCRLDSILENRRLAGLNRASKTLAEHAYRTEFHRSRKLVAAGRTGALGLCANSPKRPSAATTADSNATLHRVVRNQPPQRLAYCCPVARAIACSVTLARQITIRNKIPAVGVPWRPGVANELRRCSGSKLTVVNRQLSTSPQTVWLVRR